MTGRTATRPVRRRTLALLRRRRQLLSRTLPVLAAALVVLWLLPPSQKAVRIKAAKGEYDRFLLSLPPGYRAMPFHKWPVILFLHGSTERGTDVNDVRRLGLPAALDGGLRIPAIVVSPQIPEDTAWESRALKKLLDAVLPGLRADRSRLHVTGLSLGGFGTWNLVETYPDLFAAAAPVSGGGDPEMAYAIRDVPVWIFHGLNDVNVSPYQSMAMAEAMLWQGAEVKVTMYRDLAHDCWTETYGNRDLYRWMFSHRRKPQPKPPKK